MELLNEVVPIVSHLMFIAYTHHLLVYLFDWEKLIKMTPDNIGRLRVFTLLLSIAIGYLVSVFFQVILALPLKIFVTIN